MFTFQEMFPNVSKTQTFPIGTNWREIRILIQEPETVSDLKTWSVVFDHTRYQVGMNMYKENLCFIATFDGLNIRKDFYMPWDIYLFRQI